MTTLQWQKNMKIIFIEIGKYVKIQVLDHISYTF